MNSNETTHSPPNDSWFRSYARYIYFLQEVTKEANPHLMQMPDLPRLFFFFFFSKRGKQNAQTQITNLQQHYSPLVLGEWTGSA